MKLHEMKKFLHSKGNSHLTEESAHGMGENICQIYTWQQFNNQNF
jgi:hypothetical protein